MLQTLKALIGLPILAGIIYFGAQSVAAKVEADLGESASQALSGFGDGIFNARALASGRDVTIEGFALSQADQDRAMTAVSSLPGVGRAIDATRLLETRKPFVLSLQREGPRVVITGFTPPGPASAQIRQGLAKLGLEVEDRAEWANGAPAVFASLAAFASSQLGALDPGVVKLSDATLSLRGEARPGVDYGKLLAAAAAPPAGAKTVELDVAPTPVSPFVFSAKFGSGSLKMEGSTPYKDLEQIRALAPSLCQGAAISDALEPAGGAPREFSAAIAAGLGALAELRQGDLIISDRLVTLRGEAKPASNPGAPLAMKLPQGYGLVLQLTTPAAATP
jgi:OmpA-OmpF porin, OOP family